MRPRVIVADDFYESPGDRRATALSSGMKPHPDYHKGVRSDPFEIPRLHREIFAKFLGGEVSEGYACFQACVAGDPIVYPLGRAELGRGYLLEPKRAVRERNKLLQIEAHQRQTRERSHLG